MVSEKPCYCDDCVLSAPSRGMILKLKYYKDVRFLSGDECNTLSFKRIDRLPHINIVHLFFQLSPFVKNFKTKYAW